MQIEKLHIKNGGVEDLLNCIEKTNELVDAVNELQKNIDRANFAILDLATPDAPNSALNSIKQNIDTGELAYLQKENSDLKDEIDRLLDNNETLSQQLEIAMEALKEIVAGDWISVSTTTQIAENGLDQINNIDKEK